MKSVMLQGKTVAKLLSEKQPSLEFATPEQTSPCSDAASQIRGVALPVDGGWTSQ